MPIMELTIQQTYLQQECINRWNYLASGTPAAVSFSFALISAIGAIPVVGVYPADKLIDEIATGQDNDVSFESAAARNVYSVTDFYQTPFVPSLNGKVAGVGLSPASAFGFRTNRTRLDIRRGTKRFVGVNGNMLQANNAFTTTQTNNMIAIAAEMSEVLTYDDEGNTLSFTPIVVGREKYTPDPERPEREAYRYYGTESEQLDHIMESIVWDAYDNIRTQASRQIGRGR